LADPIAFVAQSGDTTLALTTTNNLFRVKGTDGTPVTLQKHADMGKVDALTLYSGNLYLLDRGKGELFKNEGSGITFKAGTVWLNDAGLLNKANNVAIDGNAYLTTRDGDIVKLLKGARQEFNYHAFSPRLGASSTIYTTKESKSLYILDPENKRVAILDKQGNIKDQYTSPKFDNLKSLLVNSAEDQIYVLNGKAIYLLAIKK
jgi:DNA-binding beta-propeller fold protein YncE